MTLAQLRCLVVGGHRPVTKYQPGEVYEACFICDRRLSPGWKTHGLKAPRPAKPTTLREKLAAWHERYGVRRTA